MSSESSEDVEAGNEHGATSEIPVAEEIDTGTEPGTEEPQTSNSNAPQNLDVII